MYIYIYTYSIHIYVYVNTGYVHAYVCMYTRRMLYTDHIWAMIISTVGVLVGAMPAKG